MARILTTSTFRHGTRGPAARQREISDHFIAEIGLRGFEEHYPKQLSGGMQQALKGIDPRVIENNGVEVVASAPEEFARFIKADMTRMGEVIKSGSFSN